MRHRGSGQAPQEALANAFRRRREGTAALHPPELESPWEAKVGRRASDSTWGLPSLLQLLSFIQFLDVALPAMLLTDSRSCDSKHTAALPVVKTVVQPNAQAILERPLTSQMTMYLAIEAKRCN